MNAATQNSSTISEALKARKTHLTDLLKIMEAKPKKITTIQKLTINAIKAEMALIESKLKDRK